METLPLDVYDDDALHYCYEIEHAANRATRPGWVGMGHHARTLGWRANDGWTKNLWGTWVRGELVGFCALMTSAGEPETAWVFVWVHPGHQHQGIGTALAREAERGSPPTVTRFVSRAFRRTPSALSALERRFLQPLGYVATTTETVVELDLSATPLLAPTVPTGYSIASYLNGIPTHLREQVGQLKGLVDVEAPNGDLGWDESPVTPKQYAQEIEQWMSQGSAAIETIALDRNGRVSAWTCLVSSPSHGRPATIEGTLVLREHRGHGLGLAVKSQNLHAAQATGLVHAVRTSSDDENVWMRSINSALGFRAVESETIFTKTRSPHP